MRHIDLFSGIGGFALSATWVWGSEYENVGHSEIEKYPCKVYHNHFPESECLGDITKIDWSRFAGTIDLVTGGFPCQPHSVAGKRKGSGDERDLWAECVRAIREIRPRFTLFENVGELLRSGGGRFFNRVLSDLAYVGYDAEWDIVPACAIGATHTRERVFIIANPSEVRWRRSFKGDTPQERNLGNYFQSLCYAGGILSWADWETIKTERKVNSQPLIVGVDDGISDRMDRVKSLGNAIVPQCAAVIMERIKENM